MKKQLHSQELILDLYQCDSKIISSKKKIKEFVDQLCLLIKMKKYGPLRIERFGQRSPFGLGYSFFQFIETSSIVGHLVEPAKTAYLNIFSCRYFDSAKVIQFSQRFFQAKRLRKKLIFRQLN